MASPSEVFVVVWNGESNELGSPAAIAFSEADAEAIVARAPEDPPRYTIDRWPLKSLLKASAFEPLATDIRARIAAGDLSPIILREANAPTRPASS